MPLSRRSFMAALVGLPVLGRVLQRAPLPTDSPLVTAYGNWPVTELSPTPDPARTRWYGDYIIEETAVVPDFYVSWDMESGARGGVVESSRTVWHSDGGKWNAE